MRKTNKSTSAKQIKTVDAPARRFDSIHDMQRAAEDVFNKLSSGETSVELGQAQLRAVTVMTQNIALRLEHARLSGRIVQGADVLPDLKVDPLAKSSALAPVIGMRTLPAKKTAA